MLDLKPNPQSTYQIPSKELPPNQDKHSIDPLLIQIENRILKSFSKSARVDPNLPKYHSQVKKNIVILHLLSLHSISIVNYNIILII